MNLTVWTPVIAAALWLSGCSFLLDTNEIKTMPVDSLFAPTEVEATQSFTVRLVGALTNGCQRFERLEVRKTPQTLELRMLARERRRYNTSCTDEVRPVEQVYTAFPPFDNPFEIVVHRRDGDALRNIVSVSSALN